MKIGQDRTCPSHDAGGFVPLVQTHRWGLWKKMVDTDILPKDASSWRLFSFTHLKPSMLVKDWVNESSPPQKKSWFQNSKKHFPVFDMCQLFSRPFHRSTFPFDKKINEKNSTLPRYHPGSVTKPSILHNKNVAGKFRKLHSTDSFQITENQTSRIFFDRIG